LGGGVAAHPAGADLWPELRLMALQSHAAPERSAWDALAAATRGGAAALGIDGSTGSLEAGKWADLICLDLRGPALQCARAAHDRADAICAVVFDGGRDLVTDVWVAGRQLLNDGVFTRLEWPMTGGLR
jgi:5-methylthioadenosine/S-adenosylhomocysteine deaminase